MSTFDYAEMIETVKELLAEFGNPITLSRNGEPVIDPIEGTVTPGDPVVTQPLGVILAINEDYATRWGSGIAIGDRALLMEPGNRPQSGDLITLEGEQWTVVTVDVTAPDGTDLLYEILVRP
jgi:hypothetical protein